jgi:predicted acylesterase/phospholipase RssA
MKLFVFLGALRALVEAGYSFLGVTGTSGGGVVAGALGKHWDPEDPLGSIERLIAEARTINPAKVLKKSIRWRIWEWLLTKLWRSGPKGIFQTDRLLKLFRKHAPATIGECKLPVHITGYQVNLDCPRAVLFAEDDVDLLLAMLSSMSLPPPVFDPTHYGKAIMQDGGWVRNFAVPDDQKKVVGLYFDDVGADIEGQGIVEDPEHLVDIKDNIELWFKLIFGLIDTNMRESIEEAEEEGVDLTRIRLNTTLDGFDFFATQAKIDHAIEEGYESAKQVLKALGRDKHEEDAATTRMRRASRRLGLRRR